MLLLQITRHLESFGHKFAAEIEADQPADIRLPLSKSHSQKSMLTTLKVASEDAYLNMIRTAYDLALNPTLPLTQFKTLVEIQRQNGVRLITGKEDDHHAAYESLSCINEAVIEKFAVILGSAGFMSLLTDGSQDRKTGHEKVWFLLELKETVCIHSQLFTAIKPNGNGIGT